MATSTMLQTPQVQARAASAARPSRQAPQAAFRAPLTGSVAALSSKSSSFAAPAAALACRSQSSRAASRQRLTTQAKVGDSLEEFLVSATDDAKLRQLMMSMSEAIRTIAFKVRTASCSAMSCVNSFGDEQLAVDLLADKLLFEALKFSHVCKYACSEEVPEPVDMEGEGFSVAFDPLDGSSIVDTNFTVGTIFGVWPGDKLKGITGRDQAAAGMGVFGPRTCFVIALKDAPGCHEFLLQDDGKWLHVKETTEIARARCSAPAT
jgi:sedoheptulose-bisphosphatase